jgi:integrase/recombinase XerD
MTNPLPRLIERFFGQRLARQRNVSPHTIASYRDTFKLFLKFAHRRTGKFPSALRLEDFDAELVVAFLDDLDSERRASPATYNLRLTAIRVFFRFLAFEEPAYSGQIQRVLAIPGKIGSKREVEFLTRNEIEAILSAPDRRDLGRASRPCLVADRRADGHAPLRTRGPRSEVPSRLASVRTFGVSGRGVRSASLRLRRC